MDYYGRDGVQKGLVALLAARPASLRFEALSPTGDSLGLLVSDGRWFTSFQRGDEVCYVGPACPANVARLLPLPLPTEAVVLILLGEAPLIEYRDSQVTFNRRTGHYDVTLDGMTRGERQVISVSPEDRMPRRVVVARDDEPLYQVDFSDLRPVGEALLPMRIRFQMPSRRVDLSLAYRDVLTDFEELTPEMFLFDCPKGTVPTTLHCD